MVDTMNVTTVAGNPVKSGERSPGDEASPSRDDRKRAGVERGGRRGHPEPLRDAAADKKKPISRSQKMGPENGPPRGPIMSTGHL